MSLIANLTSIVLPDGVATLPYDPSVVLVADAAQGVIWRVNTATGDHIVAIDDPTFKPTDEVPLGVNGIHILNGELYFTNLATNSVGKVTITADGSATSAVVHQQKYWWQCKAEVHKPLQSTVPRSLGRLILA